jgi:hypothetical protein
MLDLLARGCHRTGSPRLPESANGCILAGHIDLLLADPVVSGHVAQGGMTAAMADHQIRSLVLCVDLVGSRRIWPAHVGCLIDLD